MTCAPRPRISLLVTLALAGLGASCKSSTGTPRDGSSGGGGSGGAGGATGADAAAGSGSGGSGGTGGAVADAALPDRGGLDTRDSGAESGVESGATPDTAAANPGRLWFAGPESDLHLSDVEPLTPF
jgi:hypothetical protein